MNAGGMPLGKRHMWFSGIVSVWQEQKLALASKKSCILLA